MNHRQLSVSIIVEVESQKRGRYLVAKSMARSASIGTVQEYQVCSVIEADVL